MNHKNGDSDGLSFGMDRAFLRNGCLTEFHVCMAGELDEQLWFVNDVPEVQTHLKFESVFLCVCRLHRRPSEYPRSTA